MNFVKYALTPVIILFLLSGCSINGSLQGLFSNIRDIEKMHPSRLRNFTNCEEEYVEKTISLVDGQALKECFSKSKQSILYLWRPNCMSSICIPPSIVQTICDERNIDLFVVLEYFDYDKIHQNLEIKNQLLGINTTFYRSNITDIYVKRFLKDLGVKAQNNFLFYTFQEGKFISATSHLHDENF